MEIAECDEPNAKQGLLQLTNRLLNLVSLMLQTRFSLKTMHRVQPSPSMNSPIRVDHNNCITGKAVETIVDNTRTPVYASKMHIKQHIPSDYPIMAWADDHAPYLLKTYLLGAAGHTPFGRLHCKGHTT